MIAAKITEAQKNLIELIKIAESGEDVVITRHGQPIAMMRKLTQEEMEAYMLARDTNQELESSRRSHIEPRIETIDESVAHLLKQIQSKLPPEFEIRLKQLRRKCQAETLTESEHAELLTLLDAVEEQDVLRIKALSQLAQKTGKHLADLAKELGLGNDEVI